VSVAGWFRRKPKDPTPLEIAADTVNREADCAFADRKEALRAAARRLGIPIGESTDELINAMETVAK
jgi:hypothetical protein